MGAPAAASDACIFLCYAVPTFPSPVHLFFFQQDSDIFQRRSLRNLLPDVELGFVSVADLSFQAMLLALAESDFQDFWHSTAHAVLGFLALASGPPGSNYSNTHVRLDSTSMSSAPPCLNLLKHMATQWIPTMTDQRTGQVICVLAM